MNSRITEVKVNLINRSKASALNPLFSLLLSAFPCQQAKRAEKERRAEEAEQARANRKKKNEELTGEQKLIAELRHKQRKDRRAVESKDGAIEANINCELECSA